MRTLDRSGLFVLFLALPLVSCYTQLASDKADYYGYSGNRHVIVERPVHSDTTVIVHELPAPAVTQPANIVRKDDTVYVDDSRPRTDYASNGTTTIINNYYDNSYAYPSPYYYSGWYPRRHWGVEIVIGAPYYPWPVYDYYHPWYTSSWYDPYDYWGHGYWRNGGMYACDPYYPYPPSPFYNCYAPIYTPYPYWYNRGYYGSRGYYDRDNYGSNRGGNSHTGRIGSGAHRAGSVTTPRAGGGSVIVSREAAPNDKPMAATTGTAGIAQSGSDRSMAAVEAREGNDVQSQASAIDARTGDRNAPVHAVSPASEVSTSATAGLGTPNDAKVEEHSATPAQAGSPGSAATSSTRSSIYVNPSTGHRVVVIHRGAAAAAANTYGGQVSHANAGSNAQRATGNDYSRRSANSGSAPSQAEPARHSRSNENQPVERSSGPQNESPRSSGNESSGGRYSGGSGTYSGGGNSSGGTNSGNSGGRSESHSGGGRAR